VTKKTLEEAIGCWTVNPDFNSLPVHARRVLKTVDACKRKTLKGDPMALQSELHVLRMQVMSMTELVESAELRLTQIIANDELKEGWDHGLRHHSQA
jgi:hypothetical protein